MTMDLITWLKQISQDAMPAREGFQAQPLCVAVNVLVPLVYGAVVAAVLDVLQRPRSGPNAEGED